jgi:fructose-1,6-bisphosphatase I / sedoheptulose-1,7-bisphosphatase
MTASGGRVTLARYVIEEEHKRPNASGEFSALLNSIATSIGLIANCVNRGMLSCSPSSELAHDIMLEENAATGFLTGISSDSMERTLPIAGRRNLGKYMLVFSALDGRSNLDVGLTAGTIFSILRAPRVHEPAEADDFLQPGTEQVCAGFGLYGPCTMLVLTTGTGVDAFTMDRETGAFTLTHPQMRIPEDTSEFSIDAAQERFWEPPAKRYVTECLAGKTGPRRKDFEMRWIASPVGDALRILVRGGVFICAKGVRDPQGGVRLVHVANPIAMLVEQAGGAASTGRERVLDVRPKSLSQEVPLIFGSKNEVAYLERCHEDYMSGRESDEFRSPLFSTRSLFRQP